jgi:hypothetical protein
MIDARGGNAVGPGWSVSSFHYEEAHTASFASVQSEYASTAVRKAHCFRRKAHSLSAAVRAFNVIAAKHQALQALTIGKRIAQTRRGAALAVRRQQLNADVVGAEDRGVHTIASLDRRGRASEQGFVCAHARSEVFHRDDQMIQAADQGVPLNRSRRGGR